MSVWITDRLPTADDTSRRLNWCVWTLHKGDSTMWSYDGIIPGQPWMPITLPEPYVKPKRFTVNYENSRKILWYVWDEIDRYYVANKILTREAAERIAAIYEEVMQ